MSKRGRSKKSPDSPNEDDSSAFSVVPEAEAAAFTPESGAAAFTPVFEPIPESEGRIPSPFLVVDEGEELPLQPCRPAKIPSRRKPQSPFQIVETSDGFGAMPGIPGYPFHPAYATQPSPFTPAAPFNPYAPPQAYAQPYVLHPYANHPFAPPPAYAHPMFAPPPTYPTGYPAAYPTPESANSAGPEPTSDPHPNPAPIRQLELRAIFSVNHEMGAEEILQRSRSLPGIRNIAAIGGQDSSAIDSLKSLLAKLGFRGDQLRVSADQTPIEFIREGSILLAVQTDGGFAPGVRETLMIVAREMARLS